MDLMKIFTLRIRPFFSKKLGDVYLKCDSQTNIYIYIHNLQDPE